MNPIYDSVAGSSMAWVLGAGTIWSFLVFVGWAVWALHPDNRARFERAGYLPLDDGDAS